MVALAIDDLLPSVLLLAVGAVGNIGNGPLSPDMRANAIRIVALVSNDDGTLFNALEQRFGTTDVMDLARRDQEAERAPLRVDPCVDFRCEASPASADTTISTLFLTPEAC